MEKKTIQLALVGANGMLAQMVKMLAPADYAITCLARPDFDISDRSNVFSVLTCIQPDVIVNCAAFTNVDGCETNEEQAFRINGAGPGYLAVAALELGSTLVHISTDYVFPGDKMEPYMEGDPTGPVSAYGRSKLAGEQAIVSSGLTNYFILRTSWLYGPGGNNFVETILRLARDREELRIVADQQGSPTYTEDLARAIFSLLATTKESPSYGLYHFSNNGSCTWYEFADSIVNLARSNNLPVKVGSLCPIRTEEYPLPAKRPAYSVFSKTKYEEVTGQTAPYWHDSLMNYFNVRQTM
jgi:dTDP-4-dehydrorhamnose reductase